MTSPRGTRVLAVSVCLSALLVGLYVGLGGATYRPTEVADPCRPRTIEAPRGIEATLQQIALSALDGAACELRIPREDLVAALADPEARAAFLDERRISDEQLETAVRGGLERAHDDAVRGGWLDGVEALVVGEAIERAPIALIVDIAQSESGREVAARIAELLAGDELSDAIEGATDALEGAEDTIDAVQGLLD